jgi:uncharacterized protein
MTPRKLILPGGAGYLGRALTEHFVAQGWEVVVLSRQEWPDRERVRFVDWDGATLGDWAGEFEGAAAVVNLAGRSVNCRYNTANKREIYMSRLLSTTAVGQAIAACREPPPVWVNASSATIYRHALDRPMDEATGEIGSGFSVAVCRRWEKTLFDAPTPHTRRVALRTAIVFGKGEGGAMEAFLGLVRKGLGGTLGRGDQFVSWVHAADFAGSVQWILEHPELAGPVNCASPNPVRNTEFMRTLREVCDQPFALPVNRGMLEIGAFLLGTETELLLKSRRVVPGKLLASGYRFQFPAWRTAAAEIVSG